MDEDSDEYNVDDDGDYVDDDDYRIDDVIIAVLMKT